MASAHAASRTLSEPVLRRAWAPRSTRTTRPSGREGAVGPGRALAGASQGGRAASSRPSVCGDNFFNEQADAAHAAVREWLEATRPDAVVAGPAFAAGRYGSACAQVCRLAADAGIPGGDWDASRRIPAFFSIRRPTWSRRATRRPRWGRALGAMLPLVRKLGGRSALGPAAAEGYLPRGVRRPGMREASGAERAVSMLVAKLAGRPFQTEIPVDAYDAVPPAPPIRDLRRRDDRAGDERGDRAAREPGPLQAMQ